MLFIISLKRLAETIMFKSLFEECSVGQQLLVKRRWRILYAAAAAVTWVNRACCMFTRTTTDRPAVKSGNQSRIMFGCREHECVSDDGLAAAQLTRAQQQLTYRTGRRQVACSYRKLEMRVSCKLLTAALHCDDCSRMRDGQTSTACA